MSFYKIRPRSGTAEQWTSANPVLAEKEIGFEVPDDGIGSGKVKSKMGDGIHAWNDLPYAIDDYSDVIGNTDISKIGDGTVTGALSTLNSNNIRKIQYVNTHSVQIKGQMSEILTIDLTPYKFLSTPILIGSWCPWGNITENSPSDCSKDSITVQIFNSTNIEKSISVRLVLMELYNQKF